MIRKKGSSDWLTIDSWTSHHQVVLRSSTASTEKGDRVPNPGEISIRTIESIGFSQDGIPIMVTIVARLRALPRSSEWYRIPDRDTESWGRSLVSFERMYIQEHLGVHRCSYLKAWLERMVRRFESGLVVDQPSDQPPRHHPERKDS